MQTHHRKRGRSALLALVTLGGGLAMSTPADAGGGSADANLRIQYVVSGEVDNAPDVADELTLEVFRDTDGMDIGGSIQCVLLPIDGAVGSGDGVRAYDCVLPVGQTYHLGDGQPPQGSAPTTCSAVAESRENVCPAMGQP